MLKTAQEQCRMRLGTPGSRGMQRQPTRREMLLCPRWTPIGIWKWRTSRQLPPNLPPTRMALSTSLRQRWCWLRCRMAPRR